MTTEIQTAREVLAQYSFGSMLGKVTYLGLLDVDSRELATFAIFEGLVLYPHILQALVLNLLTGGSMPGRRLVTRNDGAGLEQLWSKIEVPLSARSAMERGELPEQIALKAVQTNIERECQGGTAPEYTMAVNEFLRQLSEGQREARKNPIPVKGLSDVLE